MHPPPRPIDAKRSLSYAQKCRERERGERGERGERERVGEREADRSPHHSRLLPYIKAEIQYSISLFLWPLSLR